MKSVTLALVLLVLATMLVCGTALAATVAPAPSLSPSNQTFVLGFKALAEQIPYVVGQPLEDEHWGTNGDSLQQTTRGLMVWRKSDNWTAFTDGSTTWISGPSGVQSRPNDQRFDWEAVAVQGPPDRGEITLYDRRGTPTAYIAADDEDTIYLFTGEAVAYLYGDHVYGFNGRHLGWFQDGIFWDYEGISIGFTRQTLLALAKPEPPEAPRSPRPPELAREEAPAQPPLVSGIYTTLLSTYLRMGQ